MAGLKPLVKKPRLLRNGGLDPGYRFGRGFSIRELAMAGLTVKKALKMGIPVDARRRSLHEKNVDLLKNHISSHR